MTLQVSQFDAPLTNEAYELAGDYFYVPGLTRHGAAVFCNFQNGLCIRKGTLDTLEGWVAHDDLDFESWPFRFFIFPSADKKVPIELSGMWQMSLGRGSLVENLQVSVTCLFGS